MITIIAGLCLVIGVAGAFVCAPFGYQDEDGFHYGEPHENDKTND